MGAMLESVLYLLSSFWLGAMHAATPGHGKTFAAAYLIGTRADHLTRWPNLIACLHVE